MIKARIILLFLMLIMWTSQGLLAPQTALAAGQAVEDPIASVDLGNIQNFINQIDQETRSYFPQLDPKNLLESLKSGKVNLEPGAIFSGLLRMVFKETVAGFGLMAKLIILAVLCGVLQHLQNSFEGNVGKVAQVMSYLVLVTLALASLTLAMDTGKKAIDQMVGFMQALLPVLITLLVAMGNLTSAAMFHPFVLAALGFISTIIKDIVFPLVFFGATLAIINQLSDHLKVSKLGALFNTASKVILGFSLTIFIGIMTIQGVAGSVSDGVAMRSAKFAADTFIPVVGRWLSDAVELVVSSGLVLKNALGIVAIIVVGLICLLPVIKIISFMIIYRVAAALVQPLGNNSLTEALQSMSSSLALVFGCVASVAVMFFMAVTIIMATSNFTVMLR